MYPVSEAYLQKIQEDYNVSDWYGSIRAVNGVTYAITPAVIEEGSGSITREISTKKDLKIGTTYSAELSISLYLEHVSRYELMQAEVRLFYKLQIRDNLWEEVPLGIFTVTEPPERSQTAIKLTAYDNMSKFNGNFGATLQGSAYSMLVFACEKCGVELGTDQEYIANCPNGQVDTYNTGDVPIYTYRDLIGYLASYLCCYAFIGPDGKLYLRQYDMTPVREVSEHWRYSYTPMDYECFYSSLSAYFTVTQEYEQVVLGGPGLDYDLETHPFLQFNADDVRRACLTNIITSLAQVSYTPFTAKLPCDPSLLPGDVLNFTGNHAVDGKLAAITRQVIKINGQMEVSCGGSDPNLNVMTAMEKKLANASRNANKDAMYYYDYLNAGKIKIRDGKEARIILFNYTTTKETHVDFHAEVKCFVDTTEDYDEENDIYTENDGALFVTYRQGGDLVSDYYPVDTFFDGDHLLHLFYSWWASGNIISSFEVFLHAVGCDVTIELGNSRGTIEGVGLVGDTSWDGSVYIYDEFHPYDFANIRKEIADAETISFPTEKEDTTSQNIRKVNFFSIFKSVQSTLVENGLHRFSVPYNNSQVAKENIIASGSVWKNEDESIDGSVTTTDSPVGRILKVTSNRTPNSGDVTYLCSFDHGETWYTYADGWTPYESGYGMVEGTMEGISEASWASMIAANGTIMIRAILQGNATLTDINIFMWETTSWISQGPEAAGSFDSRYVTNAGDQVELITTGYSFTGSSQSVDSGYENRVVIDDSGFSELRGVDVRDVYDNLLAEAQRDLNTWVVNPSGWTVHEVTYEEGVNTLHLVTVSGWESLITELAVDPNTDYELTFLYNCPTGCSGSGNSRRAFVWAQDWVYTNEDRNMSSGYLLGYSDVWGTASSQTPTQYTARFNSGSNRKVKIELTFGGLSDNQMIDMLFHSIKVRKVR